MLYKIISKFVWNIRKARIRYRTLLCPKEKGGLNLPNLKNYYLAAQLRAIIMWITKDADALWVGMEQNSCKNIPIESLPFLSEVILKRLKVGNVWIRGKMKVWSMVCKKLKLSNSICRATRISTNSDFLPSMMDAGYNSWTHQGFKYIAQMFRGQTLKSFQQLEQEFNLPAHDFYKFLQLRHYLKTHKEWENICKTPSKLEKLLMAYTEGETKKGAISKLYKVL